MHYGLDVHTESVRVCRLSPDGQRRQDFPIRTTAQGAARRLGRKSHIHGSVHVPYFDVGTVLTTASGTNRRCDMLWAIAVVLLVLWLLGFMTHVGGGLVHLLLVIAVIAVLIRVIQGRRAI